MKKLVVALMIVAFPIASMSMLASCDDTTPEVVKKAQVTKHIVVLLPAQDVEPSNGINKVYYSLIKDLDGDTVAIYQSSSGGVQTYNLSQEHRANSGVNSK